MNHKYRMLQVRVERSRITGLKKAILDSTDYTPHATAVSALMEKFVKPNAFLQFEFEIAMKELAEKGDIFEHNGWVVKVRKTA